MSWRLKALASIAGLASGSVLTWMIMNNQVINAKRSQTTFPKPQTEISLDKKGNSLE